MKHHRNNSETSFMADILLAGASVRVRTGGEPDARGTAAYTGRGWQVVRACTGIVVKPRTGADDCTVGTIH
jgi:hypothetical protein